MQHRRSPDGAEAFGTSGSRSQRGQVRSQEEGWPGAQSTAVSVDLGTSQWQTAPLDPPVNGLGPDEPVHRLHPKSMVPVASGGCWLVMSQIVKGPLLLSVKSNCLEVRR